MSVFQQQGKVKLVKGSILTPQNAGLRFILNFTSLAGKVDGEVYSLFDKKWAKAKSDAKAWYANKTGQYKLGAINNTAVQSDTWVMHMLCQKEDGTVDSVGLQECLKKICEAAKYEHASVHVSTLLVDQAPEMKDLVEKELLQKGISVSYYEEA